MIKKAALTALLAVLLLGSGWLSAQDSKARIRGSLPPNWGKLGLSDDQKKQVYAIQNDYRTKIDALQQQITDLRKKEQTEMIKLLSQAQKDRLKEIMASRAGTDTTDTKPKDKSK